MSQFYLTLPSNSSRKFYGENTLTKFNTRLLNPVSLQGEWEIGLAEIAFTKSWHTVPKMIGENLIMTCGECFKDGPATNGAIERNGSYVYKLTVPPGHYETPQMLIEAINDTMKQRLNPILAGGIIVSHRKDVHHPRLKYNDGTKRVSATLFRTQSLFFSDPLARVLGFSQNKLPLSISENMDKAEVLAKNNVDLTGGLQHLYVYTDVAESTPVGDTCAPLLRIVNASGENSGTVHRIYERPRYVPLQKRISTLF